MILSRNNIAGPRDIIFYLWLQFAKRLCLKELHSLFVATAANEDDKTLSGKDDMILVNVAY